MSDSRVQEQADSVSMFTPLEASLLGQPIGAAAGAVSRSPGVEACAQQSVAVLRSNVEEQQVVSRSVEEH